MEEAFELEIMYKGKPQMYEAKLLILGYTYKFQVMVDGQPLMFEPDEEGDYRVLSEPDANRYSKTTDKELMQLILEKLRSIRD